VAEAAAVFSLWRCPETGDAHPSPPPPPPHPTPQPKTGGSGLAAAATRARRQTPAPPRAPAARPRAPVAPTASSSSDHPAAATTTTTTTTPTPTPSPPIPQSIFDVDNGRILGFGPDLSPDHPGYEDEQYKRRRADIARRALTHTPGGAVPVVEYTPQELATWRAVLQKLNADLLPRHACKEYLSAVQRLGFTPDRVPQLREVDELLQRETGGQQQQQPWRLRPVAGLMHPRDFLAGLAFRTFHSTQYCRHHSQPGYTPEPDVVHELVGHVPMLLCPAYARMAEAIGRASLGADEKKLWHLVKVYWYSVEFGVVWERQEDGTRQLKAFGAGILSSSAELEWMGDGVGEEGGGKEGSGGLRRPYEVVPLDPRAPLPRMSYKDGVQRRYYALESFEQGAALLEAYAREGGPAPDRPAALDGGGKRAAR
jgi:phenylalanine-4-hydroxylase